MSDEEQKHPNRVLVVNEIEERGLETVFLLDGHDHALLGLVTIPDGTTVAAYSEKLILQELVDQGMEWLEAVEYYEFNIKSAYLGEGTPVYIEDLFLYPI
jgi:hypothetical protein